MQLRSKSTFHIMGGFNIVAGIKLDVLAMESFLWHLPTLKSVHAIETQPVKIIRFVSGKETVLALRGFAVCKQHDDGSTSHRRPAKSTGI
jgi:hypothetical protein